MAHESVRTSTGEAVRVDPFEEEHGRLDEPYIDMSEGDPVVETPEPKKKFERISREEFEGKLAKHYEEFVSKHAGVIALRELQDERIDPTMRPVIQALRADVELLAMALTSPDPDPIAVLMRIMHSAQTGVVLAHTQEREARRG